MPRSVMINDKYSMSVHTWRSSGPYFPAFELNRGKKNFEYGQLSRNDKFTINSSFPRFATEFTIFRRFLGLK